MRLITQLAEVALESASLDSFQVDCLATLAHATAANGLMFTHQIDDGDDCAASTLGESADPFVVLMGATPWSAVEGQRSLCGSSQRTDEVFSSARRDRLEVFREYLRPRQFEKAIYRMWRSPGALHFVALAPEGAAFETFAKNASSALDAAYPILALTSRLYAATRRARTDTSCAVSASYGCTAAEQATLELVARGLTNHEIGEVQGISQHTVRNRLAVCFKKLGVSRRAEAVFVLSQPMRAL